MNVTRIIVLVLALVAGLSAAWVAKSMLGNDGPVKAAKPKIQTIKVLTVSSDVSLGNRMERKFLKWQEWPRSSINSQLVTQSSQPQAIKKYTGATVRAPFLAGEPILARKLVLNNKGGFMSAILPSGMRAVSTKISAETGAGGFILPNDRVDVILTRRQSTKSRSNTMLSETILINVRVLAIDQTIEDQKKKGKVVVGKTATLELDPDQAEILALSEKMGTLSLALRSLKDSRLDANGKPIPDGTVKRSRRRGSVTVLRYGVASTVNPKR